MGRGRRRMAAAMAGMSVLVAGLVAPAGAQEEPGPCGASADHPGGDWTRYGHDRANTRTQPNEDVIGPDTVGDLDVAWVFDANEFEGGSINTTPIVADGCVYVIPSSGHAYALNADTGEVVWTTAFDVDPPGYGGGVVGAPAVDGDQLVAILNRGGSPYLAAIDRADGSVRWTTVIDEADETETSITNASVQVHDGLAIIGFSGSSGGTPVERGAFVIVDTAEGEILAKTPVIPDEDFEAGYGGGSIWSTAAVDSDTGYAYVGTGNPHSDRVEHHRTNSIIKIDVDPERTTFGEIVAGYKGRRDQYVDAGLDRQPACQDLPPVYYFASFDATCLQLDLDIGGSPNLFTNEHGQKMVGALQKAGVYHAAYADGMQRAWERVAGAPCFACNGVSAAYDGERIYVAAVPPGQMWGLDRTWGDPDWVAPVTSALHYYSVSHANGVVYSLDTAGFFNAWDADTGLQLEKHRFEGGGGLNSSGVAIARNTVYAASNSVVVAYRLAE